MKKYNHIQIGENDYLDLNESQEKFSVLNWLFINREKPFIKDVILSPFEDSTLDDFIESKNYTRSKLLLRVNNFFKLFYESETKNVLNEYLLDYNKETDKVKENRLNLFLRNLTLFIDYCWMEGAGIIRLTINNKNNSINDGLIEYHYFHYFVWKNLKGLYELIWKDYLIFIDKNKFTYNYFYSFKENHNATEKADIRKEVSREIILNHLFSDLQARETFEKYEDKLIKYLFLNNDRNKWLKDSSSLIRFYNYCEKKKIFMKEYETSSLGVKYLRKLFNFHEGTGIDAPSDRSIHNNAKNRNQFTFLNVVTNFR